MTDTTTINSSQGPVNTGPVTVNVNTAIRDSVSPDTARRNPRRLAVDELRRLRRRFEPPPGVERARQLLEERSAVLLTAAPRTGAHTAAKVLLCELPQGAERFRELVDQAEQGESYALASEQVEDGAALLLDLSTSSEDRYQTAMEELPGLLAVLRERHAQLAVVLPQDWKDSLNPLLRDLVAPLGRPPSRDVLRKHLRLNGITPAPEELTGSRLEAFLREASMAAVADLSEGIRFARDSACHGPGFGAWLSAALTELEPGPDAVDSLLAKLPTGRQRALLLTTALLHGARPDTLHEATSRLLRAAEQPDMSGPVLQHRSLTARLADVEAAPHRDGRVRFDRRKYDDKVRTYFWDNFPQLRDPLRDWITHASDLPSLAPGDLLNLVTRYVRECLRTGPPDTVTALAQHWTRNSATQAEQSMAARALGEGVIHTGYGSVFRRTLYAWSREQDLVPSRAYVVISVCSEALSRRFPDQAMTRLRHLTRHSKPGIRAAAREALLRITDADDLLHRSLLHRLRPGPEGPGRHDATLFLELADPARLARDRSLRTQFADHWAAVLRDLPRTAWETHLRHWLDRGQASPTARSGAVEVMAAACVREPSAFSGVYAVACLWARGDPARGETVDALWQRVKSALGTETSTLALHPAKETSP
ncbi:hypothetical protein [Streptomyces iconiensis]|uniref:Uncharacterized protein n=1 Tax=Streptomyces iconiensis TaxID=1384038 RepID=A0ABT6ZUR4_9ACTN|nr:hypothetical protein [Streptomyces iconiensis]MDJ1132386.1 hypothetical protein [Streptomyces iconiensis]